MPETVEVTARRPAAASPTYIIKDGDDYYVTVAVLGYRPGAPDITPAEQSGVEQVAETFAQVAERLQAVRLEGRYALDTCQSTNPPRPT